VVLACIALPQLREGWTEESRDPISFAWPLGRLFGSLEFILLLSSLALLLYSIAMRDYRLAALYLIAPILTHSANRAAHFPGMQLCLRSSALPLFLISAVRSKLFHSRGAVSWKGRSYPGPEVLLSRSGHD